MKGDAALAARAAPVPDSSARVCSAIHTAKRIFFLLQMLLSRAHGAVPSTQELPWEEGAQGAVAVSRERLHSSKGSAGHAAASVSVSPRGGRRPQQPLCCTGMAAAGCRLGMLGCGAVPELSAS